MNANEESVIDFLINAIEDRNSNVNPRYSFEWAQSYKGVAGSLEVYDKETDTGYVVKIEKILYDEETGLAINL